jgi:hypothetical protein
MDGIQPALKAGAEHIKGKINQYPPATSANTPGQKRWYERGYGPKWTRRDGSIGSRKSSEMLGRKWTTAPQGTRAYVIGNNVSYSPYVHDPEKQAAFHKARGWKTTAQVAEQEGPRVVAFIERWINKVIGG